MKNNIYDLSYLDKYLGGNTAVYYKILHSFVDGVSEDLVDFSQAIECANWRRIAQLSHKLKATYEMLGICTLSAEATLLQSEPCTRESTIENRPAIAYYFLTRSTEILEGIKKQLQIVEE